MQPDADKPGFVMSEPVETLVPGGDCALPGTLVNVPIAG